MAGALLRNHAVSLKRMSPESTATFDRRGTHHSDPWEGGEEPTEEGGAALFEAAPTAILILDAATPPRSTVAMRAIWIHEREQRNRQKRVELSFLKQHRGRSSSFTKQWNQKKKSVWIGRGNRGGAGRGMKEAMEQPFRERTGRGGVAQGGWHGGERGAGEASQTSRWRCGRWEDKGLRTVTAKSGLI
jgi:hypothetical protein